MTAPSLPEFILARVAEDEAEVDALLGESGRLADGRRLERQCEAIRRIVELAERKPRKATTFRRLLTLQALASIWSDHPDYPA